MKDWWNEVRPGLLRVLHAQRLAWFVLLGIWGLIALDIAFDQQRHENRQANAAEESARTEQSLTIACSDYGSAEKVADCYRQQSDLEAQESMSRASWFTFGVASCAMLVSVFGTLLVLRSLRHTREAVSDNREIGEKQTRAYLSVVQLRAPQRGPHALVFDIVNQGATPARRVRIDFRMFWPDGFAQLREVIPDGHPPDAPIGSFGSWIDENDVGAAPENVGVMAALDDQRAQVNELTREHSARILIRLRYQDVFGSLYEYVHACDFFRNERGPETDELDYSRTFSGEIEIDQETFDRRDRVTDPIS